jgi:hypothetical protein
MVDELTRLLTADAPGARRGPLIAQDAIVGALSGIIASCVLSNHVDQLPRLAERLGFLVLAPYTGAEAAAASIEATRRPSPPG